MPRLINTGVYVIENRYNKKVYVGSSAVSLSGRRNVHWRSLRGGYHDNRHLQQAWNKYGESQFTFRVVERCDPSECLLNEQKWIDKLNATDRGVGYNIRPKAGSNLGVVMGQETRARVAAAQVGRKMSVETRLRMRQAQLVRWSKPEEKKKQSERMKGRVVSPSARANMSKVRVGKKLPPHHLEGLKRGWAGRARRKRVIGLKAAWADPAKRAARLAKLRATRRAKIL